VWEIAIKWRLGNLLLAQCSVEDIRLVTVDRALIAHPLSVQTNR
jgi:PIN domain nuclease of toxin-antitoxin system